MNVNTGELIKEIYQKEGREFHCQTKGGSFPSNHAFNHFAIGIFLFLYFSKRNRIIAWLFILWAISVSVSRIYLGLHFPLDILGGGLMGGISGWIFYSITNSRGARIRTGDLDVPNVTR